VAAPSRKGRLSIECSGSVASHSARIAKNTSAVRPHVMRRRLQYRAERVGIAATRPILQTRQPLPELGSELVAPRPCFIDKGGLSRQPLHSRLGGDQAAASTLRNRHKYDCQIFRDLVGTAAPGERRRPAFSIQAHHHVLIMSLHRVGQTGAFIGVSRRH